MEPLWGLKYWTNIEEENALAYNVAVFITTVNGFVVPALDLTVVFQPSSFRQVSSIADPSIWSQFYKTFYGRNLWILEKS